MEFSSFDDDLFDNDQNDSSNKKQSISQSKNYIPKLESAGWFLQNSNNDQDISDRLRMKAAYYYWRGDYENAIDSYERLFKNNSSGLLHLEYTEAYARSLIARHRFEEAEKISSDFYRRAINFDQQLQALNLLSDLYFDQHSYKRCAIVSGCLLILLDGGNADIWYRLARCFINWNDSNLITISDDFIDFERLSIIIDMEKSIRLIIYKCLNRASYLYSTTFATSIGYARERNMKIRHQIENDLKSIFDEKELINFKNQKTDSDEGKNANIDENDFEENIDQKSDNKRDLDKMIDVDLVSAFDIFFKKWLL